MKITDILSEDNDYGKTSTMTPVSSSDYEKLKSFVKHNQVPGVPQNQQIALALFKEIQKQREQNKELSAELNAAEKRIDVATQGGELAKQELGKHRDELGRERKDIEAQKAGMAKFDQETQDRAQASAVQIAELTDKLEAIKGQPGVGKEAAEKMAEQIRKLEEKGIPLDKFQELEQTLANVESTQQIDDKMVNDLAKQVEVARRATQELEKTKGGLSQDIEAQLAHFKEVEKNVASLRNELSNLETGYTETDATVFDLENEVHRLKTMLAAKANPQMARQMVTPIPGAGSPATPTPTPEFPEAPAPAPAAPLPKNVTLLRRPDPRVIGQRMVDKGYLKSLEENQMTRAIAWATGKTK